MILAVERTGQVLGALSPVGVATRNQLPVLLYVAPDGCGDRAVAWFVGSIWVSTAPLVASPWGPYSASASGLQTPPLRTTAGSEGHAAFGSWVSTAGT